MSKKKNIKNQTVIGVIGIILVIFGIVGTIPLAIRGGSYFLGIIITGFMVVLGVILIAWAFSD